MKPFREYLYEKRRKIDFDNDPDLNLEFDDLDFDDSEKNSKKEPEYDNIFVKEYNEKLNKEERKEELKKRPKIDFDEKPKKEEKKEMDYWDAYKALDTAEKSEKIRDLKRELLMAGTLMNCSYGKEHSHIGRYLFWKFDSLKKRIKFLIEKDPKNRDLYNKALSIANKIYNFIDSDDFCTWEAKMPKYEEIVYADKKKLNAIIDNLNQQWAGSIGAVKNGIIRGCEQIENISREVHERGNPQNAYDLKYIPKYIIIPFLKKNIKLKHRYWGNV